MKTARTGLPTAAFLSTLLVVAVSTSPRVPVAESLDVIDTPAAWARGYTGAG